MLIDDTKNMANSKDTENKKYTMKAKTFEINNIH